MKKLIYVLAALCVAGILFFTFNVKTTDNRNPIKESIQKPIVQTVINHEDTVKKERVKSQAKPARESKPLKAHIHTISDENTSESTGMFTKSELHVFKTIHPKIMDEIAKVPECLMQADTKKDAFACSTALRTLNKKIALAMGIKKEEMVNEEQYGREFIWNEDTRVKMIEEIEASQGMMQATQDCIDSVETPKALEGCFQQ